MNVILMSLCHVSPIREFFLEEKNYENIKLPPGSIMFPLIQVHTLLLSRILHIGMNNVLNTLPISMYILFACFVSTFGLWRYRSHWPVLIQRFGDLMRKLWNPKNFRSHISPHEMLQAVVLCSKKRFQFTKQVIEVYFYKKQKLKWLK